LRSDSSPSSSGTVSGVKAQSRFNHKDPCHSLAIKPDKMRELEKKKDPRERGEKKARTEGLRGRGKKKPQTAGNKKHKDDTKTQGKGEKQTKRKQEAGE